MVKLTLEAQGENRQDMIEALQDVLTAIQLGENEAGGYRLAAYSFLITGEDNE